MARYMSDREQGATPQTIEEFSDAAWGGVVALINSWAGKGNFGIDYPDLCPDGGAIGTDVDQLGQAIVAEIPGLFWPLYSHEKPNTLFILDLLEFAFDHVGEASQRSYHQFPKHHHLEFDRNVGRDNFRERANRLLARNGLAYQLNSEGRIERLVPPVLSEPLGSQIFRTGDNDLNRTLEAARKKFLSPDLEIRKDALKDLWDAWERIKTLADPSSDKKKSMTMLLDRIAATGPYRVTLDKEAKELTEIGNQYRIRHSEVDKEPLESSAQIDYLFHRMFSMIQQLLRVL